MLIGGTLQTAMENESHLTEKDQLIVLKNELYSFSNSNNVLCYHASFFMINHCCSNIFRINK